MKMKHLIAGAALGGMTISLLFYRFPGRHADQMARAKDAALQKEELRKSSTVRRTQNSNKDRA